MRTWTQICIETGKFVASRENRMKRVAIVVCVLLATLKAGEINIAVAANVSYAMEALREAFKAHHPETRVRVTLGSSGKLTAQISHGAPYQLFLSANMKYPESLFEQERAVSKPVVYARGGLACFSATPKPFEKGMRLLTEKSIQKVAIANPKTAPYGKAALEAMQNAGITVPVKPKLIYAESISQTVSYAITAADIGFVAVSSLYSSKMKQYKEGIHWVKVDPTLYSPIEQGIVLLKKGGKDPEVQAFYNFMLGDEAKKILTDYGYMVP